MTKTSPLSLVGMSQNQRKVLAWTEAQGAMLTKEEMAAGITQGSIRTRYRAVFGKYRIGQRLRPCIVCDGTDECRFCQSTGVLPLRTKDQKSRDRCLARRDRADRRAAQEQKHKCFHAPREWIDAGRRCPDAPARCDGIPY